MTTLSWTQEVTLKNGIIVNTWKIFSYEYLVDSKTIKVRINAFVNESSNEPVAYRELIIVHAGNECAALHTLSLNACRSTNLEQVENVGELVYVNPT